MYATRDKKIKTDKRDARALCEACRLGAYRHAHRTSERQRQIRAQLLVRSTLVRTRSKYISLIGPLTATTFAATIDDATRFGAAKQVRSYLGLVPREYSSGERQHRGRISKAGGSRARTLLVEAAWALLRWRNAKNQALYDWAMRIAARRGRARACVALARKMAGILYAMWRDGTEFDPAALRPS